MTTAPRPHAPASRAASAPAPAPRARDRHLLHPARFILAPLLIVLLLAGILLALTGGRAYVAFFVYTMF